MKYGMTATVLARKGVAPLVSEVATWATTFVAVDEPLLSAFFTPASVLPRRELPEGCHGAPGVRGRRPGEILSAVHRLGAVRR